MATYVLIHGSYQGGWIWKPVADPRPDTRKRLPRSRPRHPPVGGRALRAAPDRDLRPPGPARLVLVAAMAGEPGGVVPPRAEPRRSASAPRRRAAARQMGRARHR